MNNQNLSPAAARAAANGNRQFTLKYHGADVNYAASHRGVTQVVYDFLPGVVTEFYGDDRRSEAKAFAQAHNVAYHDIPTAEFEAYWTAFYEARKIHAENVVLERAAARREVA
jgi:hypothetical protein